MAQMHPSALRAMFEQASQRKSWNPAAEAGCFKMKADGKNDEDITWSHGNAGLEGSQPWLFRVHANFVGYPKHGY